MFTYPCASGSNRNKVSSLPLPPQLRGSQNIPEFLCGNQDLACDAPTIPHPHLAPAEILEMPQKFPLLHDASSRLSRGVTLLLTLFPS